MREEPTTPFAAGEPTPCVAAVDPGRDKCGLAVVARDGAVLRRAVVPTDGVVEAVRVAFQEYPLQAVVLGDGTTSASLRRELEAAGWPVELVDEYGTTLRARERYFQEHPPRGLGRLIPTSFRTPPTPYDDYVAVLLAEDYWNRQKE
jgi:RNase H-fold protein (predicted Holliday junction resolvase)